MVKDRTPSEIHAEHALDAASPHIANRLGWLYLALLCLDQAADKDPAVRKAMALVEKVIADEKGKTDVGEG